MNEPVQRSFTVGVTGVRISDLARLEVFMRFSRGRTQAEWALVSEGRADVWLVGGDVPDTVPGEVDPPRAVVQVLHIEGECPEGALRSPLQLEDFIGLLNTLESTWESEAARPPVAAPQQQAERTAPAPPAPPASATPPIPPTPPAPATQPAPPHPAAAVAAAPAEAPRPAHADTKPRTMPLVEAGAAFRLKRWPPTAVMATHRYSARLAGLLSSRPMRLGELSALSNVAADQCTAFVQALLALGIVVQAPVVPPLVAPSLGASPSTSARADRRTAVIPIPPPLPPLSDHRPAAPPSFFDRIRRRLGIR